jgi:2-hydroxychromene-2-carboxylate isomerase
LSKAIEFYYDYGSPAAYLAWTQLPALAERAGVELIYRPILLGGVFKATGNHSPADIPAKSAWMNTDFRRWAGRYGVPFERNPHFPIITLAHMRAAIAAQMEAEERLAAMNKAIFTAIWVDGLNMNEPAVIGDVLDRAGFDPQAIFAGIARDDVKARLIAITEEAIARGVFGAPTMFVGEDMFWGQDRLDFVEAAARA